MFNKQSGQKRCLWGAVMSLVLVFCLSTLAGYGYEKELKNLAGILIEKISKTEKKKVAVVDFTDLSGNNSEFGRFISENLSTILVEGTPSFEIIDRTHLKKIMTEMKLAETLGDLSAEGTQKLSEKTGLQALITGTYMPFDDNVKLTIKVLETTSAKIVSATSGEIPKTKAIADLLNRGIDKKVTEPVGTVLEKPVSDGMENTASSDSDAKPHMPISADATVKKIMDLSFSMKQIKIMPTKALVIMNVKNDSEKACSFNSSRSYISLSDDVGNEFQTDKSSYSLNFPPKSNNDLVLGFVVQKQKLAKLGNSFGVSVGMQLTFEGSPTSSNQLSFIDIPAVKTK